MAFMKFYVGDAADAASHKDGLYISTDTHQIFYQGYDLGGSDIDLSNYATKSDISNLQTAINGKANTSHTHQVSQISNLGSNWASALTAAKPNWLTSIPSEYVTDSELNAKGFLTKSTADGYYQAKGSYLTSVSIATISDLNSSWDTLLKSYPSAYVTRWPSISEVTDKTNLVIKLNGGTTEGTNQFTYNGVTAKSLNITPSSIGAAASSHTHTTSQISGLSAVATSGSYNDLSNKPSIPSLSGYATQSWVNSNFVSLTTTNQQNLNSIIGVKGLFTTNSSIPSDSNTVFTTNGSYINISTAINTHPVVSKISGMFIGKGWDTCNYFQNTDVYIGQVPSSVKTPEQLFKYLFDILYNDYSAQRDIKITLYAQDGISNLLSLNFTGLGKVSSGVYYWAFYGNIGLTDHVFGSSIFDSDICFIYGKIQSGRCDLNYGTFSSDGLISESYLW